MTKYLRMLNLCLAVAISLFSFAQSGNGGNSDGFDEFPIVIGKSETSISGYNLLEGATANDEGVVVYTSKVYRFPNSLQKLRFTVCETGTNSKCGDYPFFSLSSFELFDENGNEIELSEDDITSNACHNALNPTNPDGQGVLGLVDDDPNTFFHSTWLNAIDEYHYIEVTLPEGNYDAFSFAMTARSLRQNHQFPAVLEISHFTSAVADLFSIINKAKAINIYAGTDPGFYNVDLSNYRKALMTAEALVGTDVSDEDAIAAIEALEVELGKLKQLSFVMPEPGKKYQIISAGPFFENQGIHKAITTYSDLTKTNWLWWETAANSSKQYFSFELMSDVDGENCYAIKHVETGLYLSKLYDVDGYLVSNAFGLGTVPEAVEVSSLGYGQFALIYDGGMLHAGDHNEGMASSKSGMYGGTYGVSSSLVRWNAGANSASAWYIRAMESLPYVAKSMSESKFKTKTINLYEAVDTLVLTADKNCSFKNLTMYSLLGDEIPALISKSGAAATVVLQGGLVGSFSFEFDNAEGVSQVTVQGTSVNEEVVESYTITYMVDGNVYHTESLLYGDTVTVPEPPVKAGFTFVGWSGLPETMPDRNVVVTGSFTQDAVGSTYPFKITVNPSAPELYAIKSGRGDAYWFTYDPSDGLISLSAYSYLPSQYWYFMEITEGEDTYLQLYPYLGEGKAMGYRDSESGAAKVVSVTPGTEGYDCRWIFDNNGGDAPYGLKTSDRSSYLSNHGGVMFKMGLWTAGPLTDTGTAMYFESVSVDTTSVSPIFAKAANMLINLQNAQGLIQNVAQFSSNAVESSEGSLAALLDNAYGTFFHSTWTQAIGEKHYLQVEVSKPINSFSFYFKKRQNNNYNRPVDITILGSNDNEYFSEITHINSGLPVLEDEVDYLSDIITASETYKYIRFEVNKTNTNQSRDGYPYFTFSEFYMFPDNIDVAYLLEAAETMLRVDEADEGYEELAAVFDTLANAGVLGHDITTLKKSFDEVASQITSNEDVTATYIKNADFSSAENWIANGGGYAYDGTNRVAEFYAGWESLENTAGSLLQEVTLPAGDYRLTGKAFYRFGESYDANASKSLGYMVAGNNKVVVKTLGSVEGLDVYANNMHDVSIAFYEKDLYTNVLEFALVEETTLNLGFECTHDEMRSWFIVGEVKLEKIPYDIKNEYRLIYTVDGTVHFTDLIEQGTVITPIGEPTKEGYTFSGWSEIPETMPGNDLTVTGTFTINSYEITYMLDGEVYLTESVVYNDTIVPVENPTKEGYTFSRWDGLPDIMPAHDVTVSAIFIKKNDGPVSGADFHFVIDKGTTKLNNYYLLDGAILNESGVADFTSPLYSYQRPVEKVRFTVMETGSNQLTGNYPFFTLSSFDMYDANGDEIKLSESDITSNACHNTLNPGDPDGAGILALVDDNRETWFHSTWHAVVEDYHYIEVTLPRGKYNAFSFSMVARGRLQPHQFPAVLKVDGWLSVVDMYALTYIVDGEVYRTDSVAVDAVIVAPEAPTKEGYTFDGWVGLPEVMPSEDVEVTASYTVNTYKVTYMLDGKLYHTEMVEYGEPITPPNVSFKPGYAFSGWSEVPATMPANDLVVVGSYVEDEASAKFVDAQGVVYGLNADKDAYKVIDVAETLQSDIVISAELNGLPVVSIEDKVFMGSNVLKSIVIPSSVNRVGDRALYGCSNLLVVEWNTKAPLNADCFDEPERHGNMLIFVKNSSTKVGYKGNVVVNGVAEQITISDDMAFRSPQQFIARNISFTRNFDKKTKIGVSGGWEAMVLPFNVQSVVSKEKGNLKPFGEADFTTSLPYWLGELQADGTFVTTRRITANKPFIMQLPNSDEYEDRYNVEGEVTFSATNVTVHPTTDVEQEASNGYVMLGSYEGTTDDSYVYALNDEKYTADGETYMPGSIFVANSRDIRPFEAYVYTTNAGRAPYLRIGKETTSIVLSTVNGQQTTEIYDLTGRKVLNTENLKGGIYIVNGKKIVIK